MTNSVSSIAFVITGSLTFCLASAVSQPAYAMSCEGLTGKALGHPEIEITSVTHAAKGEESPIDHCLVRGQTASRTGLDGERYEIRFELRLPDEWNGRFVHQFNGGNDGSVEEAFGPLLGGNRRDTALGRGYAVVSSDAGHDGSAHPDAGMAGSARFGFDPEARRHYGYGAVKILQPVAKAMTEAYYGRKVEFTYGVGGSNGGRHAMVAAARIPSEFDGLMVGYPGFNLPKAAIQHAWDVKAFKAVNADIRKAFSKEDMGLVGAKVLESCDDLDGLKDGVVADVDGCQTSFDLTKLQCTSTRQSACLSAVQVKALKAIAMGPQDSAGEQLYSTWDWDSGVAGSDWRLWKLESGVPEWGGMPRIVVLGAPSLAQIFTTPPTRIDGAPDALEKFLLNFDFDADAGKIFTTDGTFPESAMDFMTPTGTHDPDLKSFKEAGGKMIVFHGVSDPVFSVVDTTKWYERLDANNGGDAKSFAMFYRIPGMNHGARGPTTDDFDMFSPLVDWVEKGKAPGAVVAGVSPKNEEAEDLQGITRKLCPYPHVARYTGGNKTSADSFVCE